MIDLKDLKVGMRILLYDLVKAPEGCSRPLIRKSEHPREFEIKEITPGGRFIKNHDTWLSVEYIEVVEVLNCAQFPVKT